MNTVKAAPGIAVTYNRQTGQHTAKLDRTAQEQLRELAELSETCACTFSMCPGPDAPYTPMMTCAGCRMQQIIRRLAKRLGIEA